MGAKDWILVYAEQDVATVLRAEPQIDRAATERLVRRLFSHRRLVPRPDRSLAWTNPVSSEVYAGCFGGVTVIATDEAALDQPTQLDPRFLAEWNGRNLYSTRCTASSIGSHLRSGSQTGLWFGL